MLKALEQALHANDVASTGADGETERLLDCVQCLSAHQNGYKPHRKHFLSCMA